MFPLVEQYFQGSKCVRAFCAEHSISAAQLTYWRRKYRAEADRERAAFVESGASLPGERPLMEVVYPGGVRLRLFFSASSAFLLPLVRGVTHDRIRPKTSE